MENMELQYFQNQLKELKDENKELEKRIIKIETSREKTEFQYEEIMKALNKLTDETIPKLMDELDSIKNKPAKRWETVINALISAIVAGVVAFLASKIGGK